MTETAPETPLPETMMAVVTLGVGGLDQLSYRSVPTPRPRAGEVLLRVLAAGVNNTEINTRLGWYSESVETSTEAAAEVTGARSDGGWNEATPFPFIQGTDCCGSVVAVGEGVDANRIGERVIVRACMRPEGFGSPKNIWMGSDFDGAFADYVRVPATEAFAVSCDWSDAELASLPCAYGTAENMVHRAGVVAGQRVLIPGASGGVGSATVQLVRRRGADVIAIAGAEKHDQIRALGATTLLDRSADPVASLGEESVDVVIDNVGGAGFGAMLKVLRRGGAYASSGAIAGPLVALDMRQMYLKDLRLIGCTGWDEPVFPNLIGYVERGEIRPLVARTYPLERIADAQTDFGDKRHVGKFVLLPSSGT
ncbi:MAG: alcohol dehydrogenase family protein [Pseudomonadota bacterium]